MVHEDATLIDADTSAVTAETNEEPIRTADQPNRRLNQTKRPVNDHKVYHAHVYCDQTTVDQARRLCAETVETFHFRVGRFHEKPVGPHLCWSCQITFGTKDFDVFISWLDESRGGLTILVHGVTGNDLKDHIDYAYWLGEEVELNRDTFIDS